MNRYLIRLSNRINRISHRLRNLERAFDEMFEQNWTMREQK